ncbi:MAG: hypothetical protein GY731_15330 [Gammaproteobacteria bacterium]|nr:hypothetical protein [Gammaproteobacteria bacterium]
MVSPSDNNVALHRLAVVQTGDSGVYRTTSDKSGYSRSVDANLPTNTRDSESKSQSRQPTNGPGQPVELSSGERALLAKLKARDKQVRAHERAHLSAAGGVARGGAQYSYQTGPDGQRYAVGGEVKIDATKIPGNPEAALRKAEALRRAANAPVQPSAQDRAIALRASLMAAQARREIATQDNLTDPQSTKETFQVSIYRQNAGSSTNRYSGPGVDLLV